ncbi:MAG: AsmA-like C-terminal region-containing protein [Gallionella sp.]
MLNSPPIRLLWRSLSWLTRIVIVVFASAALFFAVVILASRYFLLPDIEAYHDSIVASMSGAIGSNLTIGKIEGDWRGLQPHLNFSDVRLLDRRLQPALVLPAVAGSVSWMSLFTGELRLASLEISRPELLIRRDETGKVFIGSLEPRSQGGGNDLTNWLLHQNRMVIRGGLIVWLDEMRGAPALVLNQVNLRVENFLGRHRIALTATPPSGLATTLDVRGDFHGESADDFTQWHGTLFSQIDYADAEAWTPWLDLTEKLEKGRGALRCWLTVEDGAVVGLTADLDLRNVSSKLADDVPEINLSELHGRLTWRRTAGVTEIATRNLEMRLQDGQAFKPVDTFVRFETGRDGQINGGEVRANQLLLEPLAGLLKYLPMDTGLRNRLSELAPVGKVSNLHVTWKGEPFRPFAYRIKARMENVGLNQVGGLPGFSGLTMDVDGDEVKGRLNINARKMSVDAPGVMREPLSFTTLTGQAGWERKLGELYVNVDNITVANEDLAGSFYGSYQTQAGTRGVLDLTGKLTRGDLRRAARYTPLVALHGKDSDWLNDALLAGHTGDFRIRIKGNLSDFPIDGSKDLIFKIGGHAKGAVLEFAEQWPRVENINAEFLIIGNKLEIIAPSATMLGARLQNVRVTLPNLTGNDPVLEINGNADAESNVFLDFIQKSPVRGYIDKFTDGMTAKGKSHLALYALIPLNGDTEVRVSGNLLVKNNEIKLGRAWPALRDTGGALSFTESGMQASGVTTRILGGNAIINMQSTAGGGVHAVVEGHSELEALRMFKPLAVLDRLQGGADWKTEISANRRYADVLFQSDLHGVSSGLPKPFVKRADEVMPLRFEKRGIAEGQDMVFVNVGNLINARLLRRKVGDEMQVKQGFVFFGEAGSAVAGMPDATQRTDGVQLLGRLPVLSIEGWPSLSEGAGNSGDSMIINRAKLEIDKVEGYGLDVDNLQLGATRRGDAMSVQLASKALNGELVWQPNGYQSASKLTARLRSLHIGNATLPAPTETPIKDASDIHDHKDIKPKNQPDAKSTGNESQLLPEDVPALDVSVEDLQYHGKNIGRFDLVGHPEGRDWRVRRLRVTNPDGSLMGDGVWKGAPLPVMRGNFVTVPGQTDLVFQPDNTIKTELQSQLNLLLDIGDAGKILNRSGYPNTVKGGNGKLDAKMNWYGTPFDFNYGTLNGTIRVDTGKGRFVKMEPGVGKLLSILSLQSLPKRITLDFNDVFSEGFQFDNISGNATIRNGVIESQDFHIDGSAAAVTLKGSVDLNKETQNLRVRILPTLGDSVSLIGAFAAGPAVGIGTLILNKVLGEPLDKLASFEYNVSGTWSNPSVVKVGRVQPGPNPQNPSE